MAFATREREAKIPPGLGRRQREKREEKATKVEQRTTDCSFEEIAEFFVVCSRQRWRRIGEERRGERERKRDRCEFEYLNLLIHFLSPHEVVKIFGGDLGFRSSCWWLVVKRR